MGEAPLTALRIGDQRPIPVGIRLIDVDYVVVVDDDVCLRTFIELYWIMAVF